MSNFTNVICNWSTVVHCELFTILCVLAQNDSSIYFEPIQGLEMTSPHRNWLERTVWFLLVGQNPRKFETSVAGKSNHVLKRKLEMESSNESFAQTENSLSTCAHSRWGELPKELILKIAKEQILIHKDSRFTLYLNMNFYACQGTLKFSKSMFKTIRKM